jgi:SgrR family transcriptional regulator
VDGLKRLEQYVLLQRYFGDRIGERLETSTDELTDVLRCTKRNVKLILRKLEEARWIKWQAGRGRGNFSTLTLLIQADEYLLEEAKQLVEKGQFTQAMEFLRRYPLSAQYTGHLLEWLSSAFGYRVEERQAQRFDTLRFPTYRPVKRLDPALVTRRTETHLAKQIYDTLLVYDQDSARLRPHLAHAWDSHADHTRWTFYIRKGITFHNGQNMTAHDVVYSFQRVQQLLPFSPYRWIFDEVKEMVACREHAVQLILTRPNPLFAHLLTAVGTSIVPQRINEEHQESPPNPAGTGPFLLRHLDEHKLVLDAFPAYFGHRPQLDRLEMWFLPFLYERIASEEEISPFSINFHPYQYTAEQKDWIQQTKTDSGSKLLTVNLSRSTVVQDPVLREVIHLALHRRRMIMVIGGNRLTPANSFLPGTDRKHTEALPDKEELVSDAVLKERLAASSYRGEPLLLLTYQGAGNERDSEWIQLRLMKLGIQVQVQTFDYDVLQDPERVSRADLLLTEQIIDDDPFCSLLHIFRSEASFVRQHLEPARRLKAEEVIRQCTISADPGAALRLLYDLEQELKMDHAFYFLYHVQLNATYPPELQGVTFSSLGWVDYKRLWFRGTTETGRKTDDKME